MSNTILAPVGDDWRDIKSVPKDGTTVELWYPLEGLSEHWERTVRCWWREDSYYTGWVWEGRAVRGYSNEYQPTFWRPVSGTVLEDEQAKIYKPPRFPIRPRPRRTGETVASYHERIGLRKSWPRRIK